MPRLLKHLRDLLVILIISYLLCEIAVRCFGYTEYRIQPFTIRSEPELCILPHSKLGFILNPGKYRVTVNEHLTYSVTHSSDSLRITRFPEGLPDSLREKTIDVHGCSYTYGWGVDDSLSYPFLLQQNFSRLNVRNLAVPGFGTLQTLIILREQISKGVIPDVLILNYAAFHDERNALTPFYRQSLKHGFEKSNNEVAPLFANQKFPYAVLTPKNEIEVRYVPWRSVHRDWPLRQISALVNFLQYLTEKKAKSQSDKRHITELIIFEIYKLCKQNNIRFILCGITADPLTNEMLNYANSIGIKTLKMGVDLDDPQYNSLPYDSHPNARAHAIFARNLTEVIVDEKD